MTGDRDGAGGRDRSDRLKAAYDVLGHVGGLILAVMAGAVFVQVVLRYAGRGIDGLDEVPRYLFVWLVMIGAAAAMQRGEHTVLDYFINCVNTGQKPTVVTLESAANSLKVVEAEIRSVQTGKPVKIKA